MAIVNGVDPSTLTTKDAVCMCKYVRSRLLESSKAPPSERNTCDMVGCKAPSKKVEWIYCDVCGRCSHYPCVNVVVAPVDDYVCPICIARYE